MPRVTLYGKPGCHLCDDARRALRAVLSPRDIGFEEFDITFDPALERRYRERIPVVVVDGVEAFDFVVDERRLLALLDRPEPPPRAGPNGR